jgi:hypothetical protein
MLRQFLRVGLEVLRSAGQFVLRSCSDVSGDLIVGDYLAIPHKICNRQDNHQNQYRNHYQNAKQ